MKSVATETYDCPVCGIDLAQSDFDEPAQNYYCPFCSTRQTPQRIDLEEEVTLRA
jgi:endogenous inhibitor of DNA gyrase (YacG/DUF329 family)